MRYRDITSEVPTNKKIPKIYTITKNFFFFKHSLILLLFYLYSTNKSRRKQLRTLEGNSYTRRWMGQHFTIISCLKATTSCCFQKTILSEIQWQQSNTLDQWFPTGTPRADGPRTHLKWSAMSINLEGYSIKCGGGNNKEIVVRDGEKIAKMVRAQC